MRKIQFLCLSIIFSIFCVKSQDNKKLPFDSVVSRITNPYLGADDRYNYVKEIAHLPIDKQIIIEKLLVEYSKAEEDKAKLITLYSILNNHYRALKQVEVGKSYLDSGLMYVNQTANVDALGAVYYQTGNYYFDISDEPKAHDYYYKAIANYEKSETKKVMLNFLYYRLGTAYLERNDIKSIEKIIPKMRALKLDDPNKIYYTNIYTFIATYYQGKAIKENPKTPAYLDSCLHYLKKAVQTYDTYKHNAPNPQSAQRMACQNYFSIAKVILLKDENNLDLAIENMNKGKKYMQEGDSSSLAKYHEVRGKIYLVQNELKKAISEYKAQEVLLEKKEYEKSKEEMAVMYSSLATSYEKAKDYEQAFKYLRLSKKVQQEIDDSTRYKSIKELEFKFETVEKDLKISELNESQAKGMLLTSILSVIIALLLIIILYYRIKKLKKEKEAIALSARIKDKEIEHQALLKETEIKRTRHYLDGLEAERDRLAKDLHDNVSNRLFILDQELKKLDNISLAITEQTEQLYAQIRNISHELISPVFQYTSLPEILYSHIRNLNENTDINFELNVNNEDVFETIPPGMSHEIYRIIQECIGNIIKHSSAKNAGISLLYSNGLIELIIEDDGKGFDTNRRTRGIGIQIIKDRCKTLNGNLEIVSEPGKSCKVEATIPFIPPTDDGSR